MAHINPIKINDPLLYINKCFNHPPQINNQLPKIISDRLSRNSINKEVFNACKGEYEKALKHSGYSDISFHSRNQTQVM